MSLAANFTYVIRIWLVIAIALLCTVSATHAAAQGSSIVDSVRQEFRAIHDLLDRSNASTDDKLSEDSVRNAALTLLHSCLASNNNEVRGEAILCTVNLANRLTSREQLLAEVSRLGYGIKLHQSADTADIAVLFSLGIVEHARGDMRAATMWFDSAIQYTDSGYRHAYIAAAAKVRGYVKRDEKKYEAAVLDLELANRLFDELDHGTKRLHVPDYDKQTADRLDLYGALGASLVDGGLDTVAALAYTSKAYNIVVAEDSLRRNWTYAYLVYMFHAQVLSAVGYTKESRQVIKEGLALCEQRRDRGSIAYFRLKLAELELETGNYNEALGILPAALEMFEANGNIGHQAEAHGYLAQVYERSDATVRQALYHARASHRLRLQIAEDSRIESVFAIQSDYRRSQAEHKAVLAMANADRAEFARTQVSAQRTTLLLGIVCVCGLLGFTVYQLHRRRAHNTLLEAEVAERTGELAAKTERLEASNRELERFAYIASHDLKTPLRNVTSFLGLINRRMPATARPVLGEYVEMAQSYARSMHVLVTDVLEFSRLNASVEELSSVVQLRDLCEELAQQRTEANSSRAPEITVLGSGQLLAPDLFLRQLLGNLIDNGIKYNTSVVPRIAVEITEAGDTISVAVRDNGIGIAAEYHSYVFELFKRLHTSDEYVGTGLGLASCAKIVNRLGGTIRLASTPGEGSTFTVTFQREGAGVAGPSVRHQAAALA